MTLKHFLWLVAIAITLACLVLGQVPTSTVVDWAGYGVGWQFDRAARHHRPGAPGVHSKRPARLTMADEWKNLVKRSYVLGRDEERVKSELARAEAGLARLDRLAYFIECVRRVDGDLDAPSVAEKIKRGRDTLTMRQCKREMRQLSNEEVSKANEKTLSRQDG